MVALPHKLFYLYSFREVLYLTVVIIRPGVFCPLTDIALISTKHRSVSQCECTR